jgi:hypothetical protein
MPFARAAVNGEASTVEMLERLDPSERPRYLALYPNWFALITSRFGIEMERVTLTDNLICAGPTKVIYRADWSALESPHAAPPEIIDELDVADVISEAEHEYVSPAPDGGWTTLDILTDKSGARRFDGGRTIPEGRVEQFVVRKRSDAAQIRIVVRVDGATKGLRVYTPRSTANLIVSTSAPGAWSEASATIAAPAVGDAIVLEATSGQYRNFHVWLTR